MTHKYVGGEHLAVISRAGKRLLPPLKNKKLIFDFARIIKMLEILH
jgi:hypothetical protein